MKYFYVLLIGFLISTNTSFTIMDDGFDDFNNNVVNDIKKKEVGKVIEFLNEDQNNVNAQVSGKSILKWAIEYEAYEIWELLIMRGAKSN